MVVLKHAATAGNTQLGVSPSIKYLTFGPTSLGIHPALVEVKLKLAVNWRRVAVIKFVFGVFSCRFPLSSCLRPGRFLSNSVSYCWDSLSSLLVQQADLCDSHVVLFSCRFEFSAVISASLQFCCCPDRPAPIPHYPRPRLRLRRPVHGESLPSGSLQLATRLSSNISKAWSLENRNHPRWCNTECWRVTGNKKNVWEKIRVKLKVKLLKIRSNEVNIGHKEQFLKSWVGI